MTTVWATVAIPTGHGDPDVLQLLPATISPHRVALVGLHSWFDDDFPNMAEWGRLNEPELVALGLNGEGRALIKSGAVADGLALLDEAIVSVLAGRLNPFMTGVLYCHTIAACHEVGEVLRMSRWTELAERWLTTVPAELAFGAMCAVHRAQLQLLRRAWDQAELGALHVVASHFAPVRDQG